MNIREWISNDEEVNKEFWPDDRVKDKTVNVLGNTRNIKNYNIS